MLRKILHPDLLRLLPSSVKDHLRHCVWDGFYWLSWSQEGEDTVLNRLMNSKRDGFYVDIGAHHPERFSNTALFYRRGWQGINIDANPEFISDFQEKRPRDTNIHCGVGCKEQSLIYYMFPETALNTFDADLAERRSNEGCGEFSRIEVPVRPLANILKEYLPAGQSVDFLSVDVEGMDLTVLESSDWETYRPRFVLAEVSVEDLESVLRHPVSDFLLERDYVPVAKTANTAIYADKRFVSANSN